MYSIFARISALSAILGTTLTCLTVATFLSTVFIDKNIPAELGVSHVGVHLAEDFTTSNPSKNDLGRLRLNIKVNNCFLRLFNFRPMLSLYLIGMWNNSSSFSLPNIKPPAMSLTKSCYGIKSSAAVKIMIFNIKAPMENICSSTTALVFEVTTMLR